MMEQDMIGAIKIKDGLFIGDEMASQDLEFVVANKVTHVINCAGKQIPNHWEPIGVAYLTFFWLDQDNQIIFDQKDEASNAIFEFIEEALDATESVLVHSVRGQSRATCVLAAYIMRKYRWSLLKTLEFLNSRRPELEIRATFIHQLYAYESRLQQNILKTIRMTTKWDEICDIEADLSNEELVLRNTFMNAQMGPLAEFTKEMFANPDDIHQTIKWLDNNENNKDKLRINNSEDDLVCKENPEPVNTHRSKSDVKKAIKDFNLGLLFHQEYSKNVKDGKIILNQVFQQEQQQLVPQQNVQQQNKPSNKASQKKLVEQKTEVKAKKDVTPDLFFQKEKGQDSNILSGNEDEVIEDVTETDTHTKKISKQADRIRSQDPPARVTNIINNSNINNIIINDPSKLKELGFSAEIEAQKQAVIEAKRVRKKDGTRSLSMSNKRDGGPGMPPTYGLNKDQMSRTQVFNASNANGAYQQKQQVNPVGTVVRKEISKRHESPRSRRQLLKQLAGNSANNNQNQYVNFTTYQNPAEAAIFDNRNNGFSSFANSTGPMKIGSHQFRATNAQKQLKGKRKTNQDIFGNPILNRTGPVKLSSGGVKADGSEDNRHQSRANATTDSRPISANQQDQFQNQLGSKARVGGQIPNSSQGKRQQKRLNSPFQNLEGASLVSKSNPPQRRNESAGDRPLTAPQQVQGIQASQGKRPMSPFTKIYQNQLTTSGHSRQKKQSTRSGSGVQTGIRSYSPGQNQFNPLTTQIPNQKQHGQQLMINGGNLGGIQRRFSPYTRGE